MLGVYLLVLRGLPSVGAVGLSTGAAGDRCLLMLSIYWCCGALLSVSAGGLFTGTAGLSSVGSVGVTVCWYCGSIYWCCGGCHLLVLWVYLLVLRGGCHLLVLGVHLLVLPGVAVC